LIQAGTPRVLVCGDVINDILVQTRGPLVHGNDNPAAIRRRPGGSAANQAAWMASLGLEVVFAGRVGAQDADFHRRELARFGVDPRLTADEAAATGSIVVLVGPDGERTMLTDRGANLRLRPADVPATLLDGMALLHLTGYSFFDAAPREVAAGLIAEAASRGVPFTVDPGSAAFLESLDPGAFLAWTRGAAVCFPNQDEAAVLTRAPGAPRAPGPRARARGPAAVARRADAMTMATILARHYGAVAIKLGADGAVLATAGGSAEPVQARPARVRDTTGAGDAFCAGFLAAWLTGSDLASAGACAAEAAALAVSVLGGRPSYGSTAGTGRREDGRVGDSGAGA
jgi:sugar/nucleoside kinase (ribokinase family)